jgi:hypothetical protein
MRTKARTATLFASAHLPKFVLRRSAHLHELRKVMGTSKLIDSSTAYRSEVSGRNCGSWCRDFRSAVLGCIRMRRSEAFPAPRRAAVPETAPGPKARSRDRPNREFGPAYGHRRRQRRRLGAGLRHKLPAACRSPAPRPAPSDRPRPSGGPRFQAPAVHELQMGGTGGGDRRTPDHRAVRLRVGLSQPGLLCDLSIPGRRKSAPV